MRSVGQFKRSKIIDHQCWSRSQKRSRSSAGSIFSWDQIMILEQLCPGVKPVPYNRMRRERRQRSGWLFTTHVRCSLRSGATRRVGGGVTGLVSLGSIGRGAGAPCAWYVMWTNVSAGITTFGLLHLLREIFIPSKSYYMYLIGLRLL